jgi:hypothetical protein
MVTTVLLVTAEVVTGKLTEVCPAGTVTAPGGRAVVLLVDNVTDVPPAGAGVFSKTVPVEFVPPVTVLGLNETDWRIEGAFGSG